MHRGGRTKAACVYAFTAQFTVGLEAFRHLPGHLGPGAKLERSHGLQYFNTAHILNSERERNQRCLKMSWKNNGPNQHLGLYNRILKSDPRNI